MNSGHRLNAIIRFLLEIGALLTYANWGYSQSEGLSRVLLAVGLPLLFAAIWGVFAVKGDPSRSGKTVVRTPGLIRLLLELGLFTGAALMLLDLEYMFLGWIFGGVVLVHYLVSHKRLAWLLKQK